MYGASPAHDLDLIFAFDSIGLGPNTTGTRFPDWRMIGELTYVTLRKHHVVTVNAPDKILTGGASRPGLTGEIFGTTVLESLDEPVRHEIERRIWGLATPGRTGICARKAIDDGFLLVHHRGLDLKFLSRDRHIAMEHVIEPMVADLHRQVKKTIEAFAAVTRVVPDATKDVEAAVALMLPDLPRL